METLDFEVKSVLKFISDYIKNGWVPVIVLPDGDTYCELRGCSLHLLPPEGKGSHLDSFSEIRRNGFNLELVPDLFCVLVPEDDE